jgi:hypothetical protein
MAGIATDATGISSLQSGLETPDVALNLRKQGDSIVSEGVLVSCLSVDAQTRPEHCALQCWTHLNSQQSRPGHCGLHWPLNLLAATAACGAMLTPLLCPVVSSTRTGLLLWVVARVCSSSRCIRCA